MLDTCGESPEEGYTAKYTPVAAGTSLAEPYETALIIGIDADVDTTQALDCSLFVVELNVLFSGGSAGVAPYYSRSERMFVP